jgi:hypothetical protein
MPPAPNTNRLCVSSLPLRLPAAKGLTIAIADTTSNAFRQQSLPHTQKCHLVIDYAYHRSWHRKRYGSDIDPSIPAVEKALQDHPVTLLRDRM